VSSFVHDLTLNFLIEQLNYYQFYSTPTLIEVCLRLIYSNYDCGLLHSSCAGQHAQIEQEG